MQEKMQAFGKYVNDIEGERATGKATEPTHYPALKGLLEALGPGIRATSNPKRIECGAPDFVVGRGELTIGYVEAKDVGTSLDAIEADARRATPTTHDGDQLRRFLGSLGNLVLTDYLEFRWYVDGERRATARLGTVGLDGKVKGDKKGMEAVGELLGDFLAQQPVAVGTPRELAVRMARLARMIRDVIVAAFEKEPESGTLHGQFVAFRDHLIPDLSVEQFADMYAQTVAYGLFAARATGNGGQEFSRQNAAYLLPKTNPFLRRLFNHIAGPELDDRIAWLVDDLAQLLARADMEAVLKDFGKQTKQEDPVVHFYESFLKAYDPKERKLRGVYYTPEPVVSYIVRSVDYLLRTRFDRPLGLADPAVLVLDPAVGTGTFLYDVVRLIYERMEKQGQLGAWNNYVVEKLLPRLFGFELLMAPYAVAHLKLGLLLQELGYEFQGDQRLGVYLTNTLEEAIKRSETLFAQWITEEANAAAEIKKDKEIMVVLGNPPYSVSSANKGEHIERLMERYKEAVREERNIQPLSDDYIKFIRFAHDRIERTGCGIVGMITNHTYLSGLIHRGMREELMKSFSEIYVLDLHGSSLVQERTPDGGKDDNVFDIQQGVAISLFVRDPRGNGRAKVYHAELWGLRQEKYACLAESDMGTTEWQKLEPEGTPNFFFVRRDLGLQAEYGAYWGVTEILPTNSSGIKTHRDRFVIDFDQATLRQRIATLRGAELTDDEVRERFGLSEKPGWSVSEARKALRSDGEWQSGFACCLYRPFDVRPVFYHDAVIGRSRREVMRHMLRENVGLILTRQLSLPTYQHVWATRHPIDGNTISLQTREYNYLFPLYLYSQFQHGPATQSDMSALSPWPEGKGGRRPNLEPKFVEEVAGRLGLSFVSDGLGDLQETFGPEDVFHYIYGVLHSPTYRVRYAEFLKTDFPRVPLTSDRKLFAGLAAKGAELVGLHLMESKALDALITKWPIAGSDMVEKVRYEEKGRRVWINGTQYFEGVPPEVWGFHVGGYRVCERWLKYRKGRKLSWDDVQHYQRVVVALAETIRLMGEIDALIPGWPLE